MTGRSDSWASSACSSCWICTSSRTSTHHFRRAVGRLLGGAAPPDGPKFGPDAEPGMVRVCRRTRARATQAPGARQAPRRPGVPQELCSIARYPHRRTGPLRSSGALAVLAGVGRSMPQGARQHVAVTKARGGVSCSLRGVIARLSDEMATAKRPRASASSPSEGGGRMKMVAEVAAWRTRTSAMQCSMPISTAPTCAEQVSLESTEATRCIDTASDATTEAPADSLAVRQLGMRSP
jgi:hypothetical protein